MQQFSNAIWRKRMIYRDDKELFEDCLIEVTKGKVEFKDL